MEFRTTIKQDSYKVEVKALGTQPRNMIKARDNKIPLYEVLISEHTNQTTNIAHS